MACRLRIDGLIIHYSKRERQRETDRQTNEQTVSHFSYLSRGGVFVQKNIQTSTKCWNRDFFIDIEVHVLFIKASYYNIEIKSKVIIYEG